jgi:glutamate dehydrogenase (NAD(P)+)
MRFGRLQKLLEEIKNQKMVSAIERLIGREIPYDDKKYFVRGPEEIDLVNSGLEETMVSAYQDIREVHHLRVPKESMRTAAFMIAIQKVALSYEQLVSSRKFIKPETRGAAHRAPLQLQSPKL